MTAPFTEAHSAHIKHLQSLEMEVDEQGMRLGGTYIMFFTEAELMGLHADALLAGVPHADVLEVGLGLGVFAQQAAAHHPAAYTAIEPHPQAAAVTQERVLRRVADRITVHLRPWQLVPLAHHQFDAIMYDTWPPDGCADGDFEAFVREVAMPTLRPGGRFSFFSTGPRMSPAREAVLDRYFTGWTQSRYELPADRIPAGWTKPTSEFVIPVAVR